MKATERLFFNADKSKVVAEGDPDAAFLYAAPGDEIPDSACEKFGLADGGIAGRKRGKRTSDKEASGDGDKGAGGAGSGLTVNKRKK